MVPVRRRTLFAVTVHCLVRVGAHAGGDKHPRRSSPQTTSQLQPQYLMRKEGKQITSHSGTLDIAKHELGEKTSASQPHGLSTAPIDANHKASNGDAKRIPTSVHRRDRTSFEKGSSHRIVGKIPRAQLPQRSRHRASRVGAQAGLLDASDGHLKREESIKRTKAGNGYIDKETSNNVTRSDSEAHRYVEVSKEEAHAICPGYFGIHTGNSSWMRCYDGDCDPKSDKAKWSCCADKGGVFQCPSSRPFICASKTCRGDHCCRTDCFSMDTGLKPCAGPPGQRGAKGVLGPAGAPGEAGLIGEDGLAGPMGRVEPHAKHFEAGVALSQLFAVLICNVAFMSAVFCAASCSKQRESRKLDSYS